MHTRSLITYGDKWVPNDMKKDKNEGCIQYSVRDGVRLASEEGWEHFEIETDCQILVEMWHQA